MDVLAGSCDWQAADNRPRDNNIEITFSDNGKGMTSAIRRRAFSPGVTTKARGWGLGLALVKRIVEEFHNGSIRIAHTYPDKGTDFLITFPVDAKVEFLHDDIEYAEQVRVRIGEHALRVKRASRCGSSD